MALGRDGTILRETTWTTEHGTLQYSVCLLDRCWEPLREITRAVGPFEDVASVRSATLAELDLWVRTHGVQQQLEV